MSVRPALRDDVDAADHTAACAAYVERTRPADPAVGEHPAAPVRAYRTRERGGFGRVALGKDLAGVALRVGTPR